MKIRFALTCALIAMGLLVSCSKALVNVSSFNFNQQANGFYQCNNMFFINGLSQFSYTPTNVLPGTTFSISPALAPLGLSLNPSTGTISGTTSTSVASSPFSVTVSPPGSQPFTQPINITAGNGFVLNPANQFSMLATLNSGGPWLAYLSPGDYTLGSQMGITNSVTFFGDCFGQGQTPDAILDGQNSYGVVRLSGGSVGFYNLGIYHGNAGGGANDGAGIYVTPTLSTVQLTIQNVVFQSNTNAQLGGAIYAAAATFQVGLNVYNSVFSGNSSTNGGGAISVTSTMITNVNNSTFISNAGGAGAGGAIYTGGSGISNFSGNTFQSNSVTGNNGGALEFTNGSGIGNVTNNTFYGNSSSSFGGALNSSSNNAVSVTGNTFFQNSSAAGGAAVASESTGAFSIVGNIFSQNTVGGADSSCHDGGSFSSMYNVFDDTTAIASANCASAGTDRTNVSAMLGPLQNFGPTPYFMPLTGSPAIDLVPITFCTPSDQRGVARGMDGDGHCEAGSVEYFVGPMN